ncbi:MAG: PAS domain S-box protein [Balneolaceae bacterium]|nr:PAS domain S-box protein [Balneolaceae bacterium]
MEGIIEKQKENNINQKILALAIFGVVSAVVLIVLANLSISTSSGIRSYVAAEAVWAKAQKESIIHLTNYVYTEEEEDYQNFLKVLRIVNGYKQARLEFQSNEIDHTKAAKSLEKGLTHEDDIPQMIFLMQYFSWMEGIQNALHTWEKADQKIEEVKHFAAELRDSINAANTKANKVQRDNWSEELERLDHELTDLELDFSGTMGSLSRDVAVFLRWVSVILSLLILMIGIFLAIWFLRSTEKWALSLEKTETKFRNVLDNSRDLIYKLNLQDRSYEFISTAAKNLFGYEPEEVMKEGIKFVEARTHPDDMENIKEILAEYDSETGENFRNKIEFRFKTKSGEYRWFSNTRTLLRDEQGKPVGLVGNARDITEKKQQETELQKSLEEKELLLQEIHHRVKNNLAIISSLLELQKYSVDENVQKILSNSQSRIKSIAKVHEKLYESSTLSQVNLGEYIEELVDEIRMAYESEEKDIEIIIETDHITMEVNQAIYCGLVFNELINNAYKHAFTDRKKGIIKISARENNEETQIEVANNGVELPKDYDPTTTNSLGMTLVEVLSQKYNGTLNIESGEWTRFTITFEKE